MKAVIIAGGQGTRMKSFIQINDVPKPMIKIGNKPILLHQIELLKKYGIKDIIIIVNHMKDYIINYFKDCKNFDVNINYFEETQPLGTVGGIKEIEADLTKDFIVFYGDIMINMDIKKLIDFHRQKQSQCTLVLHPNDHPHDSDLVETNRENGIKAFHPKPHQEGAYYKNLVNAGVYIFSPAIFPFLQKGVKADFGRNIFPKIFDKIKMYGYNTAEYLKDIGTPDRLKQVSNDFSSGKIERFNSEFKRKAIFLDRDGVINEENNLVCKPKDFILFNYTPEAIKKINQTEYLSVVVTNQSVIARNLCTIDEVEYIHKKLETELGAAGAKLDQIYYCPHHPDKGFPEENPLYKIECDCRKPKSGMLLEAENDYNIDFAQSFIIGDSERDTICGKNVGVTTVGVMTGKGMNHAITQPDYFFKNLMQAVNFIVDEPYAVYFEKIIEKIHDKENQKPFVINIGGNSRSGKSTLATYLRKKFESIGKKVLHVKLDNWLLPASERSMSVDVYDRFNLEEIISDITKLLDGEKITTKGYSIHRDTEVLPVSYQHSYENIIIIEGIVALSDERLREKADLKIYHAIDDKAHKEKFFDFYRWRKMKDTDILNLYKRRKKDEYNFIKKESKFADIIVQLDQS